MLFQTRHKMAVASFKHLLNTNLPHVPDYYFTGSRKLQILHTRLRTHCSSLSADLFDKNIVDSPLCYCGEIENCYHFFLSCHRYTNIRTELVNSISQYCNPTLHNILQGNQELPSDSNKSVFNAVQTFIAKSKRF